MTISGVGSTQQYDLNRYIAKQEEAAAEQQENAEELQLKASEVVQQAAQPQQANANTQQNTQNASAVASMSAQVAESLESSSDSDDSTDSALISKANSGAALTQSELSRLKDLDSALYAQAVKAAKAREELSQQISKNLSAASQSMREAVAKNSGENQEVIRNALNDEYLSYAMKYDQADFSSVK